MSNGRINITVPREVHTALRVYCVEHRLTIAEVVVEAVTRLLAEELAQPTKKPRSPV
jgi:hypothetical protein